MSFLDDIRKQPRHIREIMFSLCVITTISLVGMIWFRSFEKDLFVMMNPEPEKQARFFAERDKRTPLIYADVTKAFVNLRATMYGALGFLDDYNSSQVKVEKDDSEIKGETHMLPLSGDKEWRRFEIRNPKSETGLELFRISCFEFRIFVYGQT